MISFNSEGHTFCCERLEKHAKVSQKQGKFRRPECQTEMHIPKGNCFKALPKSRADYNDH